VGFCFSGQQPSYLAPRTTTSSIRVRAYPHLCARFVCSEWAGERVRFLQFDSLRKGGEPVKTKKKANKPQIIATRKSCDANGTGLSHYVMMDTKK
jgi:modified peptide precursor CbpA